MFQALVAFLTVMSGYVFVSTWHRTRYLLLRQPPQRVYFRAAVRILPHMSGFRSSESLELVITVYYDELYAHRENGGSATTVPVTDSMLSSSRSGQSDFEVALPIRDIRSCRLFDTALYLKYQQERNANAINFLHPLGDSVADI